MPSLKQIKSRISSINSTKKITQTMKIVSASSLKEVQNSIYYIDNYLKKLQSLFLNIYQINPEYFQEKLLSHEQNNKNNILYVVISSDKGLCSSFNSKIFTKIKSILEYDKKSKIFCIGNKVSQYMRLHYKDSIIKETLFFQENNKRISYNQSVLISNEINYIFMKHKFDECKLIFTQFYSFLKQSVQNIKMLPLEYREIKKLNEKLTKRKTEYHPIYEYDNDLEVMLQYLNKQYINILFFNACLNSLACECSSRMLAMDNATQNSIKILKEYNLLYNRSRQSNITKELIEIISGAGAISKNNLF